MEVAAFCEKYPKLMHMADADAWQSICEHGLLSTEAIADKLGICGEERFKILSELRKHSAYYPGFAIRDQRPMNSKLARCLDPDISPRQWLELLNSKVFFWPRCARLTNADRLNRFLDKYSEQPQLILQLDANKFADKYASEISLCHINSGATRSIDHKRGWNSFIPLHQYGWSRKNEVAEVTVPKRVLGILDVLETAYIVSARERKIVRFLYGGDSHNE